MATTIVEQGWQTDLKNTISQLAKNDALATKEIVALLTEGNEILARAFYDNAEIQALLYARTELIDAIMYYCWRKHRAPNSQGISIVAVGGYGRGEMHPQSDVDLLILLESEPDEINQAAISNFITQLWDLKLEIGHSVRTLEECIEEARKDLTVITNLIEARLLCGSQALYLRLEQNIQPDKTWDSAQFFKAKLGEQQDRYERYGDTAYRVEPNLKDGPGGLRDIHMISWVTKRQYDTLSLHELFELHLLTQKEYSSLIEGRDFLWKVRFAIHLLGNRKEDRLLLDHQRELAKIFGYGSSDKGNKAVEQFMQHYYRVITNMERMSELLLGIFRENILQKTADEQSLVINDWCSRQGKYFAITNPQIFKQQPHTLLEIFYLMQISSGIRGLAPSSIRLIHSHLHIIDDEYRAKTLHKKIFMSIMSESHGISHTLRRMNRYGILASWIPAFANIVGRMQFDLFHAYTVDDHTLRVISKLRRNSVPKGAKEMPYESLIFKTLSEPKLLYLAGLFHDIAKGRGGDHSELGAKDAYEFCISHHLNSYDSHLVSWLVQSHLLFSMTAQRKDISDPDVIQDFAEKMGNSVRLDYLYLLTIADMRATNPELWNGWKHSLLQDLYKSTRRVLRHGVRPDSHAEIIERKRDAVLEQLDDHSIDRESADNFCQTIGDEYINYHSVETILWQMSLIIRDNVYPLIQMRPDNHRSTTSLFIYTRRSEELFAQTTSVLGRMNIDIVSAYIMQTSKGYSLETLHIIDHENQPLSDPDNQQRLINALRNKITSVDVKQEKPNKIPRRLKAFNIKTQVFFRQDEEKDQTQITIRTMDIPGLLAILSRIFLQMGIHIASARIATLGEEVEDNFYVVDNERKAITEDLKLQELRTKIIETIDTLGS